jgi:hypothetical protein
MEITREQAAAILGDVPADYDSATIELLSSSRGNDAFCRSLKGTGPAAIVHIKMANGAFRGAGTIVELSEDEALKLGFTEHEIFEAAGARAADYLDGTSAECCECNTALDGKAHGKRIRKKDRPPCDSCIQMIRESWESAAAEIAADASIDEVFQSVSQLPSRR